MTTEFDQARTATEESSDDIETQAILLAALDEQLSTAKDALALMEAHIRMRLPLLGKNAEDREAEFLVRLHGVDEWRSARDEVNQCRATVETQRAALERARNRRQERLWMMRYLTTLDRGPIDEL